MPISNLLSCKATELVPLCDINDVYNVSTGHDSYEFIIRKIRQGVTLYFSSPYRDNIVKVVPKHWDYHGFRLNRETGHSRSKEQDACYTATRHRTTQQVIKYYHHAPSYRFLGCYIRRGRVPHSMLRAALRDLHISGLRGTPVCTFQRWALAVTCLNAEP